jgi:hypothetical protein
VIAGLPPLQGSLFGLSEGAERLVLAGTVLVGALVLLSIVGWIVPRLLARSGPAQGARTRQRQTAISALATSLRYIVLLGALVALAFVLAGGSGGVAAISGGALVVVVATFASQRLLVDAVAGFFILFEGQYSIGDVVRLEPSGYTGQVRALGLRATVLVGPGGERMIVPNGQIAAVRVTSGGHQRHRLEFLTRDPDAVTAAVHSLCSSTASAGGAWASPPRVVRNEGPDGVSRVIVVVDVDVHRVEAAAWLADAVAAGVGDALTAPPLIGVDPGGPPSR